MEQEITIVFELSFKNKNTGAAYTDCTCSNIHDAHVLIRKNTKRGWILEDTGIGVYRYNGFADYERIAYQTI